MNKWKKWKNESFKKLIDPQMNDPINEYINKWISE